MTIALDCKRVYCVCIRTHKVKNEERFLPNVPNLPRFRYSLLGWRVIPVIGRRGWIAQWEPSQECPPVRLLQAP